MEYITIVKVREIMIILVFEEGDYFLVIEQKIKTLIFNLGVKIILSKMSGQKN